MGKGKNAGGRKLVVLSGKTKGTTFVLTKPEVKAGREDDNAICLKGKRVSRYHAVLVRSNGEYTLRDMSPRIGTIVNGRPTKEAHLKLGDRICIGEFEMSYEATTAPAINTTPAPTPTQAEEITAPPIQIVAAPKESVEELAAKDLIAEHQRRIAELTQERERLAGEVKSANEAVESLRAQLQTRSDQQADMTERLGAMSQKNGVLAKLNGELQAKISELKAAAAEANREEGTLTQERERLVGEVKLANEILENVSGQLQTQSDLHADMTERLGIASRENAALTKFNSELQAKISKLETSVKKADHLEIELEIAQATLRQTSDALEEARELNKKKAAVEPVVPSVPTKPAEIVEEVTPIQAAPIEARSEPEKISEPPSPIEQVATENQELRLAEVKQQAEAVLAGQRSDSDRTNEQFDRIRKSMIAKQEQKPGKGKTVSELFMKFLRA